MRLVAVSFVFPLFLQHCVSCVSSPMGPTFIPKPGPVYAGLMFFSSVLVSGPYPAVASFGVGANCCDSVLVTVVCFVTVSLLLSFLCPFGLIGVRGLLNIFPLCTCALLPYNVV